MDRIHIEDLLVTSVHGYYEHEHTTPQRFKVSLSVGVDVSRAGTDDVLTETIDYDTLRRIVESVFAGAHKDLLETLAEDIAREILQNARAHDVTITIRKLDVWDTGVPGVTITRTRT